MTEIAATVALVFCAVGIAGFIIANEVLYRRNMRRFK